MKLKKNIPLIDQHNKYGFWGGKFGGSYIPETLKKPVEDLTNLFEKLRYDKKFIWERKKFNGKTANFICKATKCSSKAKNMTNTYLNVNLTIFL